MKKTRTTLFATAVAMTIAGQAFAHAHLASAVPAPDSTVKTAPAELDLTFSEDLNLKFTGIEVTGPNKKPVKMGAAMLMNENTTLMVPVKDTLAAGKYTVEWHALSADGHKSKGKYGFTVKP